MSRASDTLTSTLHTGQLEGAGIVVFKAGATDEPITDKERKDLLDRSLDGENIKITATITAYIQRDTPNRNGIRFKDAAATLKRIAKSGTGNPFLVNHDQRKVASRGGTVKKSFAEKDGEDWLFRQTVEFVKPWAVQGVLDGTIDRFSIGWYPSGPMVYRHSGEEIEGWPEHWPLEELDDGTIVEWVYTDADLVEVSGVNVPAVKGTEIEGIKAALAANSTKQPQREQPPKDRGMNKKLAAILGVAATLADEAIVSGVAELKATNDRLSVELAAAKQQLSEAQAIADKAAAEAGVRVEQKLEADIAEMYKAGKLTHRHGASGTKDDPMEAHLRKAHEVGGSELFNALTAGLKDSMPSKELQSDSVVPESAGGGYDANRLTRLRSSGMSPERHAELSARRALRNERG